MALVERLEIDGITPGIKRGIGPVRSDKGREALDGGVVADDVGDLPLLLDHRVKRCGLGSLRDSLNYARILDGEKPFGNKDVEDDGERECGYGYEQRDGLVFQHFFQRAAVEGDHAFKDIFRPAIKLSLLGLRRVP